MNVNSKYIYRFKYLKSEQWKRLREQVLVRENGRCQICGDESISNDVHHVWYPTSIYRTTEKQLVVLCRPCHTFVHAMLPTCKTNDEEVGRSQWIKFRNAIDSWRVQKIALFQSEDITYSGTTGLRKAYESLKEKYRLLQAGRFADLAPESIEQQLTFVLGIVKDWAKIASEYAESVNIEVADSEKRL